MVDLGPNGQILIIGGRDTNFKPEYRKHPRLVFWQIRDHHQVGDRKIPHRVVAILFTRFLSHAIKEKIQCMAKQQNIKFFRLCQNTGEIRRVLDEWLSKAPPLTEPVTVPAASILAPTIERKEKILENNQKAGRGVISGFINENVNFSERPAIETKRLYDLAVSRGITTTPRSISSAYFREKRSRSRTTLDLSSASATSKVVRTKRTDSAKLLEDFIGMTELAAVAFRELLEENKNLSAENAQLRQEISAMKDVKKLLRKIKF